MISVNPAQRIERNKVKKKKDIKAHGNIWKL